MSINATITKFGYPASLITDYEQWVLLLRPVQVTAGSLILAAKSDATAFGDLPPAAHAELAEITREVETMLRDTVGYEKMNYLMLMMVDPHVHFHVFPRYSGERALAGHSFADAGWPGQPDLRSGVEMTPETSTAIRNELAGRLRQST